MWSLLQEIRPEHGCVLQWVTASIHKDVTRKLQETQSLNFSQGAASQMWRQQLDHNLPVLHAKSKANRQNLGLLLKCVPRRVRTLNDLAIYDNTVRLGVRGRSLSSETALHPLFFRSASLCSLLFLPLASFTRTCLTP